MTSKRKIMDKNGVQVYPITHTRAVLDDNGNSVEQRLQEQMDLINQKQLEVGAVPSDVVPTAGSTNWVTSGGLFGELHTAQYVNNFAKFVKGGFVNSNDTVVSNQSWYYIHDLDISNCKKLYIKARQTAFALCLIMDSNHNVLREWQITTSPYTEEIDLTDDYPTAKYLSASNYNLADPYCNADVWDKTPVGENMNELQIQVKELEAEKNGKKTVSDIPITLTDGYINADGEKVAGNYKCCEYVDISGYDLVVAYGNTYGPLYTCIFDNNHVLLNANQSGNTGTQVVFDLLNDYPTAKYLSASTAGNPSLRISGIKSTGLLSNILMDIDDEYFLFRQKIKIEKVNGHYKNKRQFYSSESNTSYKSNLIRVKEGMTFSLTSSGYASTLNYITYNANMEMVSIIAGQTYVSQQITIPPNIKYIEFFGYEDKTLIVTCDQFSQDSAGGGGGNILAGKTYVAIGDSFTAPIGSEVIDGGRYDGQSKVYPYIIGNRNDMAVLNQGVSGSVLNWYIATGKYNDIPQEVDYITIWYGINDWGHRIQVGTIDDEPTTISAELDTTTCGGFNWFFKWLLTNRPFAHVGVIVTDFCDQNRREAIMACCEKWGIAYLDLYDPTIPMIRTRGNTRYTHDTAIAPLGYVEVCVEAKALRNAVFSTDPSTTNMHPNNTCHEWQSNLIENFMRGL